VEAMEARTPLEHGKNTVMLSLLWLIALFSDSKGINNVYL